MTRGTWKIFQYDIVQFPFQEIMKNYVSQHYAVTLHQLHYAFPVQPLVTVENDQANAVMAFLYGCDPYYQQGSKGAWTKCYDQFIQWLKETVFHESLIYQRKPTLRCQLPRNKSVGAFHRDSEYGHPKEEWNVFVPLTTCLGSSTIHLESAPDRGDYAPVNLGYGDCLIFDSALRHGNILNETGYTRLSFDSRVIPQSEYKGNTEAVSETQKIPFRIGAYYYVL